MSDVARSSSDWQRLRTSFEEVPELYDAARPGYPPQVFEDLAGLAALPEAARIVEIGCGTGQATIALAERGYRVTCIELGEQLAAFARRKLAAFPAVEVVNAAFETWQPSRAGYDAVVAFTAFHWIDPELRYAKSASLLGERGRLAVVATEHVLPDDGDQFFADVAGRLRRRHRRGGRVSALASGRRGRSGRRDRRQRPLSECCRQAVRLGRGLHGGRVPRASRHLLRPSRAGDESRRQLYERIRRRIESRPGRSVRKTYLTTLNVAARVQPNGQLRHIDDRHMVRAWSSGHRVTSRWRR